MRKVLADTLTCIAKERPIFRRSFALVAQLLGEYGEANLTERLYQEIPKYVPWEVVADLFGIILWSAGDNGVALMRTAENWLRSGEDLRRIRMVLNLDVYPFMDPSVMERVLNKVAAQHPEVADRCRDLVESRRQVGKDPAEPGAAADRPRE